MSEFMLLVLANEPREERMAPAEIRDLIEGHAAYERALREAAVLIERERLRPSAEGARVAKRGGALEVRWGPFEDEAPSVCYVVRAASLAEAVSLGMRCPRGPGSVLEVRPVMKRSTGADRSSVPGRVFSFGVLGSASSEAGWVEVMDRIDQRTRNGLPDARWLGGARLEAPSRAARVSGASRVIFDGPFLESKEIIGGLFFLRMSSLEEALAWAGETPFVEEGTLEVRELWKS